MWKGRPFFVDRGVSEDGRGSFYALTLTMLPAENSLVLSPTASFLSTSEKKRGKETPQGTDGSLTSFVRHFCERSTLCLAYGKTAF